MRFGSRLVPGILIRRYKRFLADIRLQDGKVVTVHCPNTGSMMGCAERGSPVRLSEQFRPTRKYRYTLEMVKVGPSWVGINTALTNHLVEEGIEGKVIRPFGRYPSLRREVTVSGARIDFLLSDEKKRCYVEVKNVTLGDRGTAFFPDAVSERGTKHLRLLNQLRRRGHRAAICFVVQRMDCKLFAPADHIDPVYGKTLRRVHRNGVEILVYGATVTPKEIRIDRILPFRL